MRHQPFTILLHIALAVILAGAAVTHFYGIQGTVTLRAGEKPVSSFDKESGPGNGELPFSLSLDKVVIEFYPATTTPMDFRSTLKAGEDTITVAMNRVGVYKGWRFYQSGMSIESSTLSVSHDPWGTGITYTGYILLGIGMAGYFLQRKTIWRSLLKKYRRITASAGLMVIALSANASESTLPAMQRPLAANFGKVLVYWNNRICPMQTMARDFTYALYGAYTYDGLTAEQVLSGWLFYYDQWHRDYLLRHPELKKLPPYPISKKEKRAAERLSLISRTGTGEVFRIFPYKAFDGHMEWLSLTARKPSGMGLEQWKFMQTTMPEIKKMLIQGKNIKANEIISSMVEKQRQYGGEELPSRYKIAAERVYNHTVRPLWAAIVSLCLGGFIIALTLRNPGRLPRLQRVTDAVDWLLVTYTGASLALLWYIGGHVPVSNGQETMLFMGFAALTGTVISRDMLLRGALLLVASIALSVAAMGSMTPQIGAMMPVLNSPLLSIHVMVVMIAYAIFLLTAIFAAIALFSKRQELKERLSILNRLLLPPAVCLLGAGIFIGAVWANQTWGRYWGWDPKETCALVMWLVYALPIHWNSRWLRMFRSNKVLNTYLICAILTVIFTYFGANYLLTGLHSYA